MLYVGIDYHKETSRLCAMNEDGEIVREATVKNEPVELGRFFQRLDEPCKVAFEATRNWGWLYDLLDSWEEWIDEVQVAHPSDIKAIAHARIKTDTIDGRTITDLLRANLLPTVYIPPQETRAVRLVLRQRMFLVVLQTMVKNRIHDLLERFHLRFDGRDAFGKTGLTWLEAQTLPTTEGELLREDLELLKFLRTHIAATEDLIVSLTQADPVIARLQTIPGLGPFLAVLVRYEIDAISRFPTAGHLQSYAGLVPSTYATAKTLRHGKITKQGNKYLRWAAVEAVWPAIRGSAWLRTFYDRIKRKHGVKGAKVATARKLLELIHVIWYEERTYEQEPPAQGVPRSETSAARKMPSALGR